MSAQNPCFILNENKLPNNPKNLMKSFLIGTDVLHFSNTCKKANKLSNNEDLAKIMLHLILNPHEKNVKKLRDMIGKLVIEKDKEIKNQSEKLVLSTCSVLIRTKGQEEYETEGSYFKAKQKFIKRNWINVSALEAAAWSGDIFLVRDLLKCVPKDFYHEAIAQLQKVLKEKLEHGEYLATFKTLIQSYQEFIKEYKEPKKNWKKLDKMWLTIGICQRFLSTYGLQEFCDAKLHDPLPKFDKEPTRTCKHGDGLNINLVRIGSIYTLYKRNHQPVAYREARDADRVALVDMAAIKRLCEVRTMDLENIIKSLEDSLKQENTSNRSASSVSNS